MALKFIFIISILVLANHSQATTFETTEGIYKIISCKNNAANPSPWDLTLCDNTQLTVDPRSKGGTAFHFTKFIDSEVKVRSFGLPANMASQPNGKYLEKGDFFAAYSNDNKGSGEIFVMRKTSSKIFHLSMHRRSDLFKTFDMFEIDLEKTTDRPEPPQDTAK